MKKKALTLISAVFSAVIATADAVTVTNAVPQSAEPVAGMVIDKKQLVGDRIDLSDRVGKAASGRKQAAREKFSAHKAEDVCLDYCGDILTWGSVDEYVDLQLLEAPLNIPPQATLEQVNSIVASSKIRLAEIAVNTYLKDAVIAPLAKEAGLSVSAEELSQALEKATAKAARKKHAAKVVPKLKAEGSYFRRYQENYLLSKKYIKSVVDPKIEVLPEDIHACITNRQAEIVAAQATNALLRVKIEDLLTKIRGGELDFGDAAYEFSDCGSSMENGDWGEFESDCSLLQPLKDFIFAPSTVEMSDVIETPFSYHIVKILRRYYGDEDASEDEEASRPVSPAGKTDGAGVSVRAVLPLVFAVLVSLAIAFFAPKRVSWRLYAHIPVWCVAAALAVWAARQGSSEGASGEVVAPSRVHVAHIMLEKETVPPELDEEAARAEVHAKKLGQATFVLQRQLIETAQTNGTLKCDVRMTLLNKVKLLEKLKGGRK